MKAKYIDFDMMGVKKHPQQVMKDLGIKYFYAVPICMADAWWFFGCENIPKELPTYLSLREIDLETVSSGVLTKKTANNIMDYLKFQTAYNKQYPDKYYSEAKN